MMRTQRVLIYLATALCLAGIAHSGTNAWWAVPVLVPTCFLAGYDLRGRIEGDHARRH